MIANGTVRAYELSSRSLSWGREREAAAVKNESKEKAASVSITRGSARVSTWKLC
jgi:hypothetical protein